VMAIVFAAKVALWLRGNISHLTRPTRLAPTT